MLLEPSARLGRTCSRFSIFPMILWTLMGTKPADLEGKVAIVTGADRVDEEIALALAAHGAHLVLTGRTMDKLQAVEAEILKRDGKASSVAGDVASDDDVARCVGRAVSEFGTVDILVNEPGVPTPWPSPRHSTDERSNTASAAARSPPCG